MAIRSNHSSKANWWSRKTSPHAPCKQANNFVLHLRGKDHHPNLLQMPKGDHAVSLKHLLQSDTKWSSVNLKGWKSVFPPGFWISHSQTQKRIATTIKSLKINHSIIFNIQRVVTKTENNVRLSRNAVGTKGHLLPAQDLCLARVRIPRWDVLLTKGGLSCEMPMSHTQILWNPHIRWCKCTVSERVEPHPLQCSTPSLCHWYLCFVEATTVS